VLSCRRKNLWYSLLKPRCLRSGFTLARSKFCHASMAIAFASTTTSVLENVHAPFRTRPRLSLPLSTNVCAYSVSALNFFLDVADHIHFFHVCNPHLLELLSYPPCLPFPSTMVLSRRLGKIIDSINTALEGEVLGVSGDDKLSWSLSYVGSVTLLTGEAMRLCSSSSLRRKPKY